MRSWVCAWMNAPYTSCTNTFLSSFVFHCGCLIASPQVKFLFKLSPFGAHFPLASSLGWVDTMDHKFTPTNCVSVRSSQERYSANQGNFHTGDSNTHRRVKTTWGFLSPLPLRQFQVKRELSEPNGKKSCSFQDIFHCVNKTGHWMHLHRAGCSGAWKAFTECYLKVGLWDFSPSASFALSLQAAELLQAKALHSPRHNP